ncbi:MAG: hypothetical protein UBAL2_82410066 [Leptospirillum rubarum]|jgi:hypothetical protein|nr:MAG: hypothetical protein UBAL2_82410066 [Leptospirillum rubarum]
MPVPDRMRPKSRRLNPLPFLFVIVFLGLLIYFVAYPIERLFLGDRLTGHSGASVFPVPGAVGYLKAEDGYVIFAAEDKKNLLDWQKDLSDPIRQRQARSFLENGTVVVLPPGTSAVSVAPEEGKVQVLSGDMFGKTVYVLQNHVHFIVLPDHR